MPETPTTRVRLTRRRILEAALSLVDREGSEALTMRRLGREVGVEAMSLYNHVAGRAELLDGLSEVMVTGIEAGAEAAKSWDDALRQFMRGIRAVALAHPAAFQLVGMRPLNTRAAMPPVERLLGALRAGGFDADSASSAYRLAVSYARGFALAEIGGFTLDAPGERLRAPDLSAEEFPRIVELAPSLSRFDHEAAFEFGVEAIVAGLGRAAGA
ncbi:MAG TPA: TetR/AcrR family transcriptional regulator C-terminal domain-containing protein [Gaiellaceae bacterium]|nr:TetR/AcrR family transcriptional regulator C-terminal domain-containing protein [Gaiellaceae bacterium]